MIKRTLTAPIHRTAALLVLLALSGCSKNANDSDTPSGSSGDGDNPMGGDGDNTPGGDGDGDGTGSSGGTNSGGGAGSPGTGPIGGDIPPLGPVGESTSGARNAARVFYSGHSLMDNPMPDYVAAIASAKSDDFNYNFQNSIGSPIRVRTIGGDDWSGYSQGKNRDGNNMDVVAELRNPQTLGTDERYDTLVITERHDILLTLEWEDTIGYLWHYHNRLRESRGDGTTLLYHSWLAIDVNDPSYFISYEKEALGVWECAASKVNLLLEREGAPQAVSTLPVGAALVDLVERILAGQVPGITGSTSERLNQIFSDNVHVTALGAWFTGAATYAGIFRKSPLEVAPPEGISQETADALAEIAWAYMENYYSEANRGVRTMEECRGMLSGSFCKSFFEHPSINRPELVSECETRYMGTANIEFVWPHDAKVAYPTP